MSTVTKKVHKFRDVPNGTKFRIYSEPSRDVTPEMVTDHSVYEKVCPAWSTNVQGVEKDIILYPNDLVTVVMWPKVTK